MLLLLPLEIVDFLQVYYCYIIKNLSMLYFIRYQFVAIVNIFNGKKWIEKMDLDNF